MISRSFKHYLMESVKTYHYKIKIAGDPGKNWLDMFTYNLNKFDPVKISAPKSTPVQEAPYGFPGIKNQSVTIIDVEFKYPATEPMIKQVARLLNWDENMVRCIQAGADDSWSNEAQAYRDQEEHSPLLGHTELEDGGTAAKDAAKAYGDSYLSSIKDQRVDGGKTLFAAGSAGTPHDPFKRVDGNGPSPLSKVTRPSRPRTGASK